MERGRFALSMLLAASLVCSCLTGCGLFRRTDREADPKNELTTIRLAIGGYARDRDQFPHTLQELVDAGYLKEIPIDPMTRRKDWQLDFDEDAVESKERARGIVSVHSNSSTIGSNGLPYGSW
jgi:general secretion pathway protein G